MKRLFSYVQINLTLVIIGYILFISDGCSSPNHEGFAIYLTKAEISPSQLETLCNIELADQPIIGINDIITYNTETHELKLTTSTYENISKLDIPVSGRSFVVCVDRKPIYWGAFWTPISSISFDGVTIWKPFSSGKPNIVTLELGYPSSSFYGGEDPRNNQEVTRSLEQAGKIVDKLSLTAVDKLPRSMKGYELYSCLDNSQWHFTLITGTNRNKTIEEIISNHDFISEARWVQIHVVGVDAIKTVFNKLPQNEFLFWLVRMPSEQTAQDVVNITLPPKTIIDDIKEYAIECGLDFTVQQF